MIYTIANEYLQVQVNDQGAQLWSVRSKATNVEYLWQGDPNVWSGRAYNLFPFIGRCYGGSYRYEEEEFPVRCHGLARYFDFTLETQTSASLTFLFTDNEETKKEYPFSFEFRVTFLLEGNALITKYTVTNKDTRELICAFGGHPGINVPFDGGKFEDYYLEFSEKTDVRQELLAESNRFMADKNAPYPLKEGTKIPLRHELFDCDALILSNTSNEVAVKKKGGQRYVSVEYLDFPFIGFWQMANIQPQYVCVEPWSALPGIEGQCTVLETKKHMTRVPVGEERSKAFTLRVHE